MSTLKAYVSGLAISILYTACRSLGLSTAVTNTAVNALYSAFYGLFGDALALAFAPIVWLYTQIQNVDISIPSWITNAVNYLTNTIRPNWNWVINTVDDLSNFWSNRHYYISQVISSVLGDWGTIFYYARWMWDNARWLIDVLLYAANDWIWSHLPNWAKDAIHFIANQLHNLSRLVAFPLSLLGQFLADPIGFVFGLFDATLKAAWLTLTTDLNFLIWLFSDGKRFLISFVTDPVGTILALIEKYFIPWLERLIAENW